MSKNLLDRYIWIVDTIRRNGYISLSQLNKLWINSIHGESGPLPRRTFYNYRNAIQEIFGINIECSKSTFEYYIAEEETSHEANVTDWMLNTASISNTLTTARDIADRIFLEDVPSARHHLSTVIEAMRSNRVMHFSYSPYSRSGTAKKVTIEPYFLKIFRLRWYITGRNTVDDKIKTYALDRMDRVVIEQETFAIPPTFDAEAYFSDAFGIVFSQGEPRKVILRVSSRRARYFRDVPLHHSQVESVTDQYSIFTYQLRLTPDLVEEILSYGPEVTVLAPGELKAMVVTKLQDALDNYQPEKPTAK